MNIFFTSDVHFYHKAILRFSRETRRGGTPEEMTELLVNQWNSQVALTDRVYHLGDFSFGNKEQTLEVLDRLNGRIHFIRGNHDHPLDHIKNTEVFKKHVEEYTPYKEDTLRGQKIIMCHFPIIAWNRAQSGSWAVHGHTHGSLKNEDGCLFKGKIFDVGIDNRPDNTMALWSFDELKEIMDNKEIFCYDMHTKFINKGE